MSDKYFDVTDDELIGLARETGKLDEGDLTLMTRSLEAMRTLRENRIDIQSLIEAARIVNDLYKAHQIGIGVAFRDAQMRTAYRAIADITDTANDLILECIREQGISLEDFKKKAYTE